jgi:Fic family protein
MYIHQLEDWPQFHWDTGRLAALLALVRHRQGRLIGRMESLGFNLRQEAILRTLTSDVLESSAIEGEKLEANQVRSSIARRLGIDIGALKPRDRQVEGVVEMMLDATGHYDQPLTSERLFGWHAALFPTGRIGMSKYAQLTKSSQDTALRDILLLVERGILVRGPEGGRSTGYALADSREDKRPSAGQWRVAHPARQSSRRR